jgi:hypothetical protein
MAPGVRAMTVSVKGDRREPLFLSEADARAIIRDAGGADSLGVAQIDLILSRLRPQFWIAPRTEADNGGTRLGGAPDLPKGTAWPMRPAMPERAKKAAAERFSDPWVIRQLGEEVPFEFLAQIDLAEAARHPATAEGLPKAGRLLFFLDDALLMANPAGEPAACRIIHDAAPVGELAPAAIPRKFEEMEAWWRTPDPAKSVDFETQAENLEAMGMKEAAVALREVARKTAAPDPALRKPFVYPARAMRLVPILALPEHGVIEFTEDRALRKLLEDEAADDLYQRLTTNDTGPFTADPDDRRVTQSWLMREARRNRLMGLPAPEQHDPRYDGIPASERPPYPWNDAQDAAMRRKAEEWRLLLQLSVADLSQQQTEGTLYFMVRKADLSRGDFSRAVVSYQQT